MKLPRPEIKESKFGGYDAYSEAQMRQAITDTINACINKVDLAMLGQPYEVTQRVVRALNMLKEE